MISPVDACVQAFLAEIRKMYGSNILFFHNAHETLFIAGIWNPQTGIRNWKANLGYSSMPVLESGSDPIKIAINKVATLHDLARLGGSLVSKIDVKR
jgi:U3 small nucleolar RNA-associated protein 22